MWLFILLGLVLCSAAIGASMVVLWGGQLLGRDDVRARSMRSAWEINRLVIEARSRLVDEALRARRQANE